MRNLCFLLLLMLPFTLPAQFQLTFQKTYGGLEDDRGYCAREGADGRIIVGAGKANSWTGDPDSYILCVGPYGDTVWTRSIPLEQSWDDAGSVLVCSDGNYLAAVNRQNTTMATGLQKYSTDGDPLWGFQYGAAADDYTNSMVLAPDGSYVVCGYSYAAKDNPLWGSHMFNRKHDQTGGIVWRNDFESSGVDYGMGIDNTPDGGFILCGKKDPPGEDDDAWLLKANSQGQKEWEKFFGNPGALETASSVRSVPSGGYILCGSWYPGIIAMNGSVYIVKTDASGILEWSKKFGGSGNDYGVSVDHTSDGGYIVLGVTDSFSQVTGDRDLWLLRLNSLGDTVWTKRFGGQFEEGGGSVIQTADGGFLVCGYTRSYGHGGADVYLIKTNENGVVTSTSEARTDKHEFIVFPNPTKGAITITAPLKSNGYEITDITGRVICSLPGTESLQPVTIDLGNKNEGLYFITVFTETGSVCKKIIKTN